MSDAVEPACRVVVVPSGIDLPPDHQLEIVLVQWDTPLAARFVGGIWEPASEMEVAEKRALLHRLSDALTQRPQRTRFILLPELSTPQALVDDIEELCGNAKQPLVVAFGLEALTIDQYLRLATRVQAQATLRMTGERVNAAGIWIRRHDGKLHRSLQLKRHPSDNEIDVVACGEEAFVFRSPGQGSAKRLNFAVAICSDFANRKHVRALLEQIDDAEIQGLDLMFVLQMNEDQMAEQFLESVSAYFEPSAGSVITHDGAMVFINQPTSDDPTKFGRSKIHFKFRRLRFPDDNTPPTFRLEHDGEHRYEAAVFRDNRPSAYVAVLPALQLVDDMPGSGNFRPFNEAVHVTLTAGDTPLQFRPLPAVVHWMFRSLEERQRERDGKQQKDFSIADSQCHGIWMELFENARRWWQDALGPDDMAAKQVVQTLLRGQSEAVVHSEPEPFHWNAEEAVEALVEGTALVRLGMPTAEIARHVSVSSHVMVDGQPVVFLFGSGLRAPTLIQEFRHAAGIHLQVEGATLAILMRHRSQVESMQAPEQTSPPPPPADTTLGFAPNREPRPTNITRTELAGPTPRAISGDALYDALCNANTIDEAGMRIANLLRGEFA